MSQDIIAWHSIPGDDTEIPPAHDLNGNGIQFYRRHRMAVEALGTDGTPTLDAVTIYGANITGCKLSFGPVRGSWYVYRATLRHQHHPTKKPAHVIVADFRASIMLNGITMLHKRKKRFLVGDSSAGIVYWLHGQSDKVAKVLDYPFVKPKKPDSGSLTFNVGTNEMTVYDGHL